MASWLSGLANKAEDMLNSVDKAAASSLSKTVTPSEDPYSKWTPKSSSHQDPPGPSPSPYLSQISRTTTVTSMNRSTHHEGAIMTSSLSVPSNLNKLSNDSAMTTMSRSMHAQSSTKASPSQSKRDKDEELFEFLNSPDSVDGNHGNKRKDKPASGVRASALSSREHSRQSSTSSVSSQRSAKTPEPIGVMNSQLDDADSHGKFCLLFGKSFSLSTLWYV